MKIYHRLFVGLILFFLAACQPISFPSSSQADEPVPPNQSLKTPSPQPSKTPIPLPTKTPQPSSTATALPPSETPTIPPPAPLSDLLEGVEVVNYESFDRGYGDWNLYNANLIDGSVGFDETLPPGGSIQFNHKFVEGEGVLFKVKYTGSRAGVFGYCFENGVYQTNEDKQFCVSNLQYPYIFRGKEYISLQALRGQGSVKVKKDIWISVLHVVAPGGIFFTAFWLADDPSKIATKYYDGHYAKWTDTNWQFFIYREDRDKTPFIVDEYMQLRFKDLMIKK